jgi:hypothetical protein
VVDRICGLDGVRADIAMMRTQRAPANTRGIRNVMFGVAPAEQLS